MKRAFSLVEMLIVIFIFGLVLIAIISNSNVVLKKSINTKFTTSIYKTLKNGVGDYVAENGMIKSLDDLCLSLKEIMNVNGVTNCMATISTTDNFKDNNPNITLNNGMLIYNLGSSLVNSNAASKLSSLKEEELAMSEAEENSDEYNTAKTNRETLINELKELAPVYIIYVDIDGKNGNGKLNEDVVIFSINLFGEVLPYGEAANNVKYISAGYKYFKPDTHTWTWVQRSLTFKDAVCKTGIKLQTKDFCSDANIDQVYCKTNECKYVINN